MTTRTSSDPNRAGETGHVRFAYRLRVSSTARVALAAEWGRCRWLWNECVAKSKETHAWNEALPEGADKRTCGPAQLDRMLTVARARTEWLREGSSVPQQQLVRDFGRARAKAQKDILERLPAKRRAGMPTFKRKHSSRASLNYTRRGFRLKGDRLHLARGIELVVVWSRELPAAPTSVRVHQDSLGHWYASFVVPARTSPLSATSAVIGIDWGVKETATTTSERHDLPHPAHGKRAQARLARYDRMMARRKPARGHAGSKGYRRAKHQRAKAYKKVSRQRQHTARTWAKTVVQDHGALAVEDFKPTFLAKTNMARKASDAAIGATKRTLIEMARKHGRDVHLVHPAFTTTDCAQCGARAKHALPLGERTYTCTACGKVSPRDKNSAHVMLIRAGLTPAGEEGTRPTRGAAPSGSPSQESPPTKRHLGSSGTGAVKSRVTDAPWGIVGLQTPCLLFSSTRR